METDAAARRQCRLTHHHQGGRGGVCPPRDPPAWDPGSAQAGYHNGPQGHQGDGMPVQAPPCHPKSPRAALLKLGEEREHLGTMRDPLCLGRRGASFRDSFCGTFGSPGPWAAPYQGQEDFGGLLSLSWADPIDPSQSLNGAQDCRCGDRSGREAAVRAHTSAVGVCPCSGPGPRVSSQRPCWSAQATYHGGP